MLSRPERVELTIATQQLGDLLRRNVEDIKVDDHMIAVPSPTTIDATRRHPMGAIVPFLLEGQDAGNFSMWYLALFALITPDDELLADFGHIGNSHKHVALLAFTALDVRIKYAPHWERAKIGSGKVMVPFDAINCGERHRLMTVHFAYDRHDGRISVTLPASCRLWR